MLSRIARGMYSVGRQIERAKTISRVLEVNHKMHLERDSVEGGNIWLAIAEEFDVSCVEPSERAIYEELVVSRDHRYSVMHCIGSARSLGRSMRDHISEELWDHLNRYYLETEDLDLARIRATGHYEFNRQLATFCDAFSGLADDTMIHGAAWHFLRVGHFMERTLMVCRVLGIKRKTLALAPESVGRPLADHQWQALLRSLCGYEAYRRAHDARILPVRVLEFVLRAPDFPHSLVFGLTELGTSLRQVATGDPAQAELLHAIDTLRTEVRTLDCDRILSVQGLEGPVRHLASLCAQVSNAIESAYFTNLRPVATPIRTTGGTVLVPQ